MGAVFSKKNPLLFAWLLLPVMVAGSVLLHGRRSISEVPLDEPWATTVAGPETPEGLAGIRAADCGVCHKEIYAEWRASTHARAMVDPQFQKEWAKDGHLWLCINCHAPLANQQAVVVTGLNDGDVLRPAVEPNPDYDPALALEGITCAVCHVRDGRVHGLRGDTNAPHAVVTDPERLVYESCLACHNAVGRITGTIVCNFDTGDDWRRTGLPASDVDCIQCHMPAVARTAEAGRAARTGRAHHFPGSGVPKFFEDDALVSPRTGLEIEIILDTAGYTPGETGLFEVRASNRHAGHSIPTGDVERFVLLRMSLKDRDEGRVYWEGEERMGEVWQWSPEARQVSDNSLAYGEERLFRFHLDIPSDTDSLVFEVAVENHRMSVENAKAMGLLGTYPLKREVLRESVTVAPKENNR